jgi:site-specific recombinase XerD
MDHKPKLLDQVRNIIRLKHTSIRTEQSYVDSIKRFILFHHKRHPGTMGTSEVSAVLSHLAMEHQVVAFTQRQAIGALVFWYREILGCDLDWLEDLGRAKKPARLPVVFTRAEVRSVLVRVDGLPWLMASLLYGAGLRLMESVHLRIKDVDFGCRQSVGRDGKGQKDRVAMFPRHKELRTTMIYTHVLNQGAKWVRSPLHLIGWQASQCLLQRLLNSGWQPLVPTTPPGRALLE